MTTAGTRVKHRTPVASGPDQDARHLSPVSKLFVKDHAYAARLVQLVTAIRSVVRSTVTKNVPDQIPSVIQDDDLMAAGIVRQPRTRESGP
jgi:hypothetical protein